MIPSLMLSLMKFLTFLVYGILDDSLKVYKAD